MEWVRLLSDKQLGNVRSEVEEAISLTKKASKNRREMGCLFVARLVDGKLKLEEVKDPDLLLVAHETRKTLSIILMT
jgi:hypothetical protein